MADRRMFAKTIVTSDAFLDMPSEAQALYFQLNMAADDDGFVDNPRSIMRICGASNDAMKILMAKKFVLTFEKGDNFLVVIKHWKVNNYIRKDTYRETRYKELMRELYYDENGSYSLNPGEEHKPVIADCDEPVTNPSRTRHESLTQDSIGKDSIGKDNTNIPTSLQTSDAAPSFEQVTEYMAAKGCQTSRKFYDTYSSKAWYYGKKPWKQLADDWIANEKKYAPKPAESGIKAQTAEELERLLSQI